MPHVFRGVAVFPNSDLRDEFYNRFEDYIQSVLDVVPYPDVQAVVPDGLAKWSNYHGTEFTGPAFSVSIKIPDEEATRCTDLGNEIEDRPDCEFGWSEGEL